MNVVAVALLAGAAALAVLAALASAAQLALSRVTLATAEGLAADGRRGAKALLARLADPARNANRIALLGLSAQVGGVALLTAALLQLLPTGPGIAAAVVLASVALFSGVEVAPKTTALQHTERVACLVVPPVAALSTPLGPFARALIVVGNWLAPGRGLRTGPFVTEEQLRAMIDAAESDEVIEAGERAMIHSIFELGDTVVREIMVPRPDMVTVHRAAPLADVLDVVLAAGHSRVPVHGEDRDEIVGLLYAKDVLRWLHTGAGDAATWSDLLRPASFVPDTKPVDQLLRELQTARVHLAVVVDEYGSTIGLVTIEDILEEIVGEIEDEYDAREELVEELGERSWRVDGRLPVDELSALLDTDLPAEDWDTVGGLLFGLLGHVAAPGERVTVEGVSLTAETVQGRRIAKVLVDRTVGEVA